MQFHFVRLLWEEAKISQNVNLFKAAVREAENRAKDYNKTMAGAKLSCPCIECLAFHKYFIIAEIHMDAQNVDVDVDLYG